MSRAILGAALLLSTLATTARAQEDTPVEIGTPLFCVSGVGCSSDVSLLDDITDYATQGGVDPTDLLGALETLQDAGYEDINAREYLFGKPEPAPPESECGWPICGALGQRLYCVEEIESRHGAAMWNPRAIWNGEHSQGWLGYLPSTARSVGVTIGNRWSEWHGAVAMLTHGRGREFYGVAAGIC